jgi:hypothetical protein
VLITARRWQISLSGSVLVLVCALAALAGGVLGLLVEPLGVATLFITLLSFGLCVFVAGEFRFASVAKSGRLFVRTLFRRDGVDSRSCALGVSIATSSHRGGRTYTIYATDGTARAVLAECWTRSGSQSEQRRLEACFGIEAHDHEGTRRVARERVETERARVAANFAAARRQVDGYYASGVFGRVGKLAIGFAIVYVAGFLMYAWLTGTKR